MYPVSQAFLNAVKAYNRKYYWTGKITTTAGTVYNFDQEDMVKGSGYATSLTYVEKLCSAKLHESEAAADDGVRDAVSTMKKYSGETELSREIVEAFIDKVLIYDPEHIEIRWKFPDEVVKFIEG